MSHLFIKDSIRCLRMRLEKLTAAVDLNSEFIPQLQAFDQELRRMRVDVVRLLGVSGNPKPLPEIDEKLQDQDAPCHCCHCTDRQRRQQEENSLVATFYGLPHQF